MRPEGNLGAFFFVRMFSRATAVLIAASGAANNAPRVALPPGLIFDRTKWGGPLRRLSSVG
jgi:hypothetical protein